MATCTLQARIAIDLRIVLATQTVIDLSRQRSTTATEDTTFTVRIAAMAAYKIKEVLGDVGSYDDTDVTVGDLGALEIAVRLACLYYANTFTLVQTDSNREATRALLSELAEMAGKRVAEVTPQYGQPDNTELDKLYPTKPIWEAED